MTKVAHDDILDAASDEIRDNANILTICSEPPTTRTEAITTFKLADVVVDNTDFTKAAGDANGRKLIVGAQSSVDIDATGNGNHLAICDGTRLLVVNELGIGTTGRANTAQGGSSTTIQLDASASAVDDEYNNFAVTLIRDADGSAETRIISDYVGSTKTATVPAWTGADPTSSDAFKVFGQQLTSGGTINTPAFDIEFADPTPADA